MKHSFTAIDIGSSTVCGVVGFVNNTGQLHVSSCHSETSEGVHEGVIVDMDSTIKAIRKVITKLEFEIGSHIDSVYVAISGRKLSVIEREEVHIRPNYDKEISEKELTNYIEELSHIYLPSNEVIVDIIPMGYQLDGGQVYANKPIGLDCREIKGRYKIVTCEQRAYRHLERCLAKANLKIVGKVLSAEAAGWACLTKEERKAGAAVVDIGYGMTDISFFQQGILTDIHVLPIGGDIITSDISKGCRIITEQAEKLKIGFGCATVNEEHKLLRVKVEGFNPNDVREISVYNLSQIIKARMDDISGLVDEVVTASGLRDDLIAGLVLTGGTSKMKLIVDNFAQQTGLDVRSNHQQVQLQYKPISQELGKKLDASFTVALGTLIKVANDMTASKKYNEAAMVKANSKSGLQPLPPLDEAETVDEEPKKEFFLTRWFKSLVPMPDHEEFAEELDDEA